MSLGFRFQFSCEFQRASSGFYPPFQVHPQPCSKRAYVHDSHLRKLVTRCHGDNSNSRCWRSSAAAPLPVGHLRGLPGPSLPRPSHGTCRKGTGNAACDPQTHPSPLYLLAGKAIGHGSRPRRCAGPEKLQQPRRHLGQAIGGARGRERSLSLGFLRTRAACSHSACPLASYATNLTIRCRRADGDK